jgi:DASH complex subunit DAM1
MSQNRAPSQTRLPSRARSRSPVASRPTTPLRPSSRSSFRNSQSNTFTGPSPLDAFEPQFAELSDSMADLEANLMHLQLMHESLSRFGESFASFLYGLNMNAFVVDFPEVGILATNNPSFLLTQASTIGELSYQCVFPGTTSRINQAISEAPTGSGRSSRRLDHSDQQHRW